MVFLEYNVLFEAELSLSGDRSIKSEYLGEVPQPETGNYEFAHDEGTLFSGAHALSKEVGTLWVLGIVGNDVRLSYTNISSEESFNFQCFMDTVLKFLLSLYLCDQTLNT